MANNLSSLVETNDGIVPRAMTTPMEETQKTETGAVESIPMDKDTLIDRRIPPPDYSNIGKSPVPTIRPEVIMEMSSTPTTTAENILAQHSSISTETVPLPDLSNVDQPSRVPTLQPGVSPDHLVPSASTASSRISFDDYLSLSEITFEWGDSYDEKDWMRLEAILAPTLLVDYTEVNGHKWDSMPAREFLDIMSNIGFVGDPLVHTQHHIGASKWQKISEEEVIGHHQLRAAHQRYTSADLKTVENKGHGHAMVKHFYKKINGTWKLAGIRPRVRWNEFEFDKIFKGI